MIQRIGGDMRDNAVFCAKCNGLLQLWPWTPRILAFDLDVAHGDRVAVEGEPAFALIEQVSLENGSVSGDIDLRGPPP